MAHSHESAKKKVLVILAEGAEEAETVCTVDVLRRGKFEVVVAGLEGSEPVTCSRGVRLLPDASLHDALAHDAHFDAIVLPGGMGGTIKMRESDEIGKLLKKQEKSGKIIAAICAATTVLAVHGIGKGIRVTSHPSVKGQLPGYHYDDDVRVVVEGPFITSRGPGTALEFGLAIVRALGGEEAFATASQGLVLFPGQ
eukprot:m.87601 g.87601  ORF g.87601 m.87601 type:complete len:197 (+) comp13590_c0_seq2:1697-2287(+)